MIVYVVKDLKGRIWKTFKDEKDANDYCDEMNEALVSDNVLSVDYQRVSE